MKIDYVTIFDSNYVVAGLTMVRSLLRHSESARVSVFAADEYTYRLISALEDERLTVLDVRRFESDDLRRLRSERSRVEYIWTLTPFLPTWLFQTKTDADIVVYVDADMYFFGPADGILQEFILTEEAGVMITPHDYSKGYDQTESSGIYCVQFLPFRRDTGSQILFHWQRQCLEWCFARVEPGRFGDQKYLEEWPGLFLESVHIQRSLQLLGAPWNAPDRNPKSLLGYHFHGFRQITSRLVSLHSGYRLDQVFRGQVYSPYLQDFADTKAIVMRSGNGRVPRVRPNFGLMTGLLKDMIWPKPGLAQFSFIPGDPQTTSWP